MDSSLINQAYLLKESLKKDQRIIDLEIAEKEMEESEEVMKLSYLKDATISKYNDIPDILEKEKQLAMKEISIAKEKLQSHPLVKKYLECYLKVKDLYNEINSILFDNLNSNLCPKK